MRRVRNWCRLFQTWLQSSNSCFSCHHCYTEYLPTVGISSFCLTPWTKLFIPTGNLYLTSAFVFNWIWFLMNKGSFWEVNIARKNSSNNANLFSRKIVKSMDFVATTITKRIKEAIERDKIGIRSFELEWYTEKCFCAFRMHVIGGVSSQWFCLQYDWTHSKIISSQYVFRANIKNKKRPNQSTKLNNIETKI